MTYMDHVPAQKRAASYLQHVMKEFPKGRFLVAGHQRGNLATYACSYLPDSLFEGSTPSTATMLLASTRPSSNRRLPAHVPKHSSIVPQGSIVGMMLEVPELTTIVKSRAFGGFAQHDAFTWEIKDYSFVTVSETSPDSQQTDLTLKQWVRETSAEERKSFLTPFLAFFWMPASLRSMTSPISSS